MKIIELSIDIPKHYRDVSYMSEENCEHIIFTNLVSSLARKILKDKIIPMSINKDDFFTYSLSLGVCSIEEAKEMTDTVGQKLIEALNDECIRLRQEIDLLKATYNLPDRTCGNCKYGEPYDCFTTFYCLGGVKECVTGSNSLDFSCNKWKRKD